MDFKMAKTTSHIDVKMSMTIKVRALGQLGYMCIVLQAQLTSANVIQLLSRIVKFLFVK